MNRISKMVSLRMRAGQAIAEYLILTALIAIASIGIIQLISRNLRGKLGQVNQAIIGERSEFKGVDATERQTGNVDMGTFNDSLIDVDEK